MPETVMWSQHYWTLISLWRHLGERRNTLLPLCAPGSVLGAAGSGSHAASEIPQWEAVSEFVAAAGWVAAPAAAAFPVELGPSWEPSSWDLFASLMVWSVLIPPVLRTSHLLEGKNKNKKWKQYCQVRGIQEAKQCGERVWIDIFNPGFWNLELLVEPRLIDGSTSSDSI